MKNLKLNNAVLEFQRSRSDESYAIIHEATIAKVNRKLEKIASSVRSNYPDTRALYEDVLLRCIKRFDGKSDFSHFYNAAVAIERRGFNRKNVKHYNREVLTIDNDDEKPASFEIADEFNLEAHILKKRKADHRQLIGFLLNGADAKTTAIVEAFLASEKSSPTAIGEELGLHHSTVIRTLKRLAGKFDSKKFGEYQDFLVAL